MKALIVAAALAVWAVPASGQVTLKFDGGRVTLSARNAQVRAILAEWTRVGGTTIVNGDRMPGAAVTLELTNVPERQAIDILLRSAAGYIVGPRQTGSTGTSMLGRILILPTSTGASGRQTSSPAAARTGAQPARRPTPTREPDPEDDNQADDVPAPDEPNPADAARLRALERQAEAAKRTAERRDQIFVGDQAGEEDAGPRRPGSTPGNPFGLPSGAATRPGVVTPTPQQPNAEPDPQER